MFDVVVDEPPLWIDEYDQSLVDSDVSDLDADATLDEIVCCEKIIAAAQARQLRALAHFASLRPGRAGEPVDEFAADEVAALLRISRVAAQSRLDLARTLQVRLPATLVALDAGELDLHKARIVADHTSPLCDRQATEVEDRVLSRAMTQTPGQLRAALRAAVLRVDPDGAERRRQRRICDRAVLMQPGEDGTAGLTAVNLDAADAVAAYRRLDSYARTMGADDGRSMDQRRADVLIDLVLGRELPSSPGGGVEVQVTVGAGTLLGLDELPGELAGYGPISAQAARELAGDGTWRRLLTEPSSGAVLDVGRASYRPPTAMARHVRTRDRTCRFPGCRQPARNCDLDHTTEYPAAGTSADNLSSLCRHHHRLKHRTSWQAAQQTDGLITWTSPTGRTYETAPEPYGDGRPAAEAESHGEAEGA